MKNKFLLSIKWITLFIAFSSQIRAQCTGWNNIQATDSIFTNPFFGITTSPEADKLNRNYDYLATVAGGVKIYDNNISGNPTLVSTVPTTSLGNLDAINLYQDSIWLYVCLGNIWDTTEMAGLAIIDVSNPISPVVLDYYVHPGLTQGSGAVAVKGNYAYLAANQNGLIILDISTKTNIQFVSALPFNNNFPHTIFGNQLMYNARGIDVKGNYAFVCYDRGGLRVVDISNVNAPVQVSQYCFPPLIDHATAYNNIVIHNNLAYVAIDYYGMEILDISNPTAITQVGWWHPGTWADTTNNPTVWANSDGHANEIAYDSVCNMVYLVAGKTDLVAIDVNNPSAPSTCQSYGTPADDYGTWGMDYYNNKIHIAYIWSIAAPPYSNYTGYKILPTNCSPTGINENFPQSGITLSPNPTNGNVYVNTRNEKLQKVKVYSLTGNLLQEHFTSEFSITDLSDGVYFIVVQTTGSTFVKKLVKQ